MLFRFALVVALASFGCKTASQGPPKPINPVLLPRDPARATAWLYERHPVGSGLEPLRQTLREQGLMGGSLEKSKDGDDFLFCEREVPTESRLVTETWKVWVAHRDGRIKNIQVHRSATGL